MSLLTAIKLNLLFKPKFDGIQGSYNMGTLLAENSSACLGFIELSDVYTKVFSATILNLLEGTGISP